MSFRTQRLLNRFPSYTKARRDSSSMTSRFFNTFAEGLESNYISAHMNVENMLLEKENLGRSFLYEMQLEGEDVLEPVAADNGYTYEYPELTGDSIELTRVDSLTDLLCSPPTRLNLLSDLPIGATEIWNNSDPHVYGVIAEPERLWIEITGSEWYVNKTPNRDLNKSPWSSIHIVGLDKFYKPFRELIHVSDDGVFQTKCAFQQVTEITYEGFDGDINITTVPGTYVRDSHRILVFEDMESPLDYRITNDKLEYSGNRFKLGRQYRTSGSASLENSESKCLLQLTNGESELTPVGLCLSPENTLLYVIDEDGRLSVYDPDLPEFTPPITTETTISYMELLPLQHYAEYNATESVWVKMMRQKQGIAWIKIKRIDPAETVSWLQADNTWGGTETRLTYTKDFRFNTVYDQLGEWEYALYVQSKIDSTVSVTKVMVGSLNALVVLEPEVASPLGLYFNEANQLVVYNAANRYIFSQSYDKWIIDESTSRIWLSDPYTEVVVS